MSPCPVCTTVCYCVCLCLYVCVHVYAHRGVYRAVLKGRETNGERSLWCNSVQVLWRGKPRQELSSFSKDVALVRQDTDDVLLPTATAREALDFAAALCLPHSGPFPPPHTAHAQQCAARDRVQELLSSMRLSSCADTLVGDAGAGVRGLSGGERRRLATALALVQSPALLIADEPTSGQDSATAAAVLAYLKRRMLLDAGRHGCRRGVLIVSLHQPGPALTAMLDDLLLLAPGGRTLYAGPAAAVVDYFSTSIGASPPPPFLTGLADWLLETVLSGGGGGGGDDKRMAWLHTAWLQHCRGGGGGVDQDLPEIVVCALPPPSTPSSQANTDDAPGSSSSSSSTGAGGVHSRGARATTVTTTTPQRKAGGHQLAMQVLMLSKRSLMWWWRHPAMLLSGAVRCGAGRACTYVRTYVCRYAYLHV
jgi:ABC-type multidrug transport system ATPase subunit